MKSFLNDFQFTFLTEENRREFIEISKQYEIISKFTQFIAMESTNENLIQRQIPVEIQRNFIEDENEFHSDLFQFSLFPIENHSTTNNSFDFLSEILQFQDFDGLWRIEHRHYFQLLFHQHLSIQIFNDQTFRKIQYFHQNLDRNLIFSMILIGIFQKYFINDEFHWRSSVKKTIVQIENFLGNQEFHQIMISIRRLI